MAYEGQELEGRAGFRLKLLRISEEVLEMEASRVWVVACSCGPVRGPAGTPHQMAGDGAARVH
jgi:hypothetical protein